MSETNAPPPGEGEGTSTPQPEPQPTPAPAPAPDAPESEEGAKHPAERRFAELSARMSAMQRDRDRMAAEVEFFRRNIPQAQQQQGQDTPEARYMREREAIRQEVEAKVRTDAFHEQGATQYPDWRQRCDDLIKLGADPHFAQLLVEMPEGTKVAAALAEDPAAVERIAGLRSATARSVALGKYAATIEGTTGTAPTAPHPVSRAPAPIRPVSGRAAAQFNEYTADPQALVDKYMRDDIARRTKH